MHVYVRYECIRVCVCVYTCSASGTCRRRRCGARARPAERRRTPPTPSSTYTPHHTRHTSSHASRVTVRYGRAPTERDNTILGNGKDFRPLSRKEILSVDNDTTSLPQHYDVRRDRQRLDNEVLEVKVHLRLCPKIACVL